MGDALLVKMEHFEKSIVALSKTVKSQGRALGRVEQKVFNGFGAKIDNLTDTLTRDRLANDAEHKAIQKSLSSIIKFILTAFISIFIVLLSILGSLWFGGTP